MTKNEKEIIDSCVDVFRYADTCHDRAVEKEKTAETGWSTRAKSRVWKLQSKHPAPRGISVIARAPIPDRYFPMGISCMDGMSVPDNYEWTEIPE